MEPISVLLTTAAGYILRGAAQSKAADSAKEEILGKFWNWIKKRFVTEAPVIELQPKSEQAEILTLQRLLELMKDETFREELRKQVAELQQAGISHSNNVVQDSHLEASHVGDVHTTTTMTHSGSGDIVGGSKHETHNYSDKK